MRAVVVVVVVDLGEERPRRLVVECSRVVLTDLVIGCAGAAEDGDEDEDEEPDDRQHAHHQHDVERVVRVLRHAVPLRVALRK